MNVFIGNKEDVRCYDALNVSDFVKPLINRYKLSVNELLRKYGNCYEKYNIVYEVEEADFCILPYPWNFYVINKKENDANYFINLCRKAGKEILTVNTGDFGVKISNYDTIVLRQSGYQSKRKNKQFSMPVFFSDPVKVFYNDKIVIRDKKDKALVGFCGQGKQKLYKYAAVFLMTIYRNLSYYLGASPNEPQVVYPSTLRRNRVLNVLSESNKIDADFIIREKYRGGVRTKEELLRTTLEFYNNIRNTDYTVCIRGGGNFSVRIYETLANGWIPLFINTDSILPLDNFIDWKKHVVWVEEKETKYVDEILADFHNDIHTDDFIQMQMNNRKLWLDYLSFQGFYCHLDDLINNVSKKEII
jgi:hypothetical protein